MGNCTETALQWYRNGVLPIPLRYRTKHMPLISWGEYTIDTANEDMIKRWFFPELLNMALACGGKRNLVVIDFDKQESFTEWYHDKESQDTIWGEVARTGYKIKTSRGYHVYVYSDKPLPSWKDPKRLIDIRSNGQFVLTAPSLHPSGLSYHAVGTLGNIYTVSDLEEEFKYEPPKVGSSISSVENRIESSTMRFMTPSDLRSRYPILQFVNRYSEIRKARGSDRWWYARCINPLHKDTHPSFQIDTLAQRAKCLSPHCALYGEHGRDIIDLYMILNNADFVTAMRNLYAEIGIYDNILENA